MKCATTLYENIRGLPSTSGIRPWFEPCVYNCLVLGGVYSRRRSEPRRLRVPRWTWDGMPTTAGGRINQRAQYRMAKLRERATR